VSNGQGSGDGRDARRPRRDLLATALLPAHRYLRRGELSAERWSQSVGKDRDWERFYRSRWSHEKVVRSTHGVNCTGSCSWRVYVKDGLITWETQQVDYPSNGPQLPDYEPRGCPRGASFSWYEYSPLRVRYPYVRGVLLARWREALAQAGDPVAAWARIVEDEQAVREYRGARGKGGFVRSSWEEVAELIAAAHVYTIKRYGPDRIAGFSPIPAMSMVSYAAGARFLSLIGGVVLSFYDWYADLPPASPQIWGDQTDVPESADWWDAGYLVMWGTNIPMTRTPDAHFMTEARYRGAKTVVVSPDYSDHTKFADEWLAAAPGSDGALALAMAHVILKEFHVERRVEYFDDYVRRFTDLPFLVTLRRQGDAYVPDRFLRASDVPGSPEAGRENADWRTVVFDERSGQAAVPNGTIGDRWGEAGKGRWNLQLGELRPALSLIGSHDQLVALALPRFDGAEGVLRRGVPVRRVGEHLVATVFDLLAAQLGVRQRPPQGAEELPGSWPQGYEDPSQPCTPAWQEAITGVPAAQMTRIARELARNAERTRGRSMIMMGAGTNHWYHSDQIYRAMLTIMLLCGCQGVNGGGWAHYVGQEKVRTITGFSTVAFAADWCRPPRHQAATPFWYLATDQWRYDPMRGEDVSSPLASGALAGRHIADLHAQAARLGWLPSHPTFDRNPLELADAAAAEALDPADYIVRELREGRLRFACEDPDAPECHPRILTVWRSNLLGSSGKGHEYFLKHLLGVPDAQVRGAEIGPERRPTQVRWREQAPAGKLDLLVTLDFRMNGTCLYSDIVLPAATWYEKEDLATTDLHPFVHAFNAAVAPPWETRSDWDIFRTIAAAFSRLAAEHLGERTDVVAAPLLHDSPDELAQPLGEVRDWISGECDPVPGRTLPKLVAIRRDYGAVAAQMDALGPLVEEPGLTWKGVTIKAAEQVAELGERNGLVQAGAAAGRPSLARPRDVAEAIMALSGTTNGRFGVAGFAALAQRSGVELVQLAAEHADEHHSFRDISIQPRKTFTSPEWSGIESRERRYSPFTMNVECALPWRTLTGRQQLYLDHAWMRECGDALPIFRPPLKEVAIAPEDGLGDGAEVALRYLTPHSKWSIHSTYQDNLHMLTLFRGGPVVWLAPADAERIGVADNDWIEMYNRNGVVAARAVVSHRIRAGSALMYHAQDRHVNVPRSELSGARGGTHNSVTRIQMKPTHMIGGYAQLAYGFNYYGPTGSQRDEVTIVRRRRSKVIY